MENVVLIVHLILALALIGIVLMQRSEGGGLGMGGGGGAQSGRSAATALGKLTWLLAIAFICTSISLTIIAAQKSSGGSVVDRLSDVTAPPPASDEPDETDDLLAPSEGDDAPLVPSAD
ncbi:preprotein translocase subunit SecG [Rhodobacteraceae bacterium 63075]|nr:preprotein translocase subunit SecG [Rhodobacteraceae bacterium 63075]